MLITKLTLLKKYTSYECKLSFYLCVSYEIVFTILEIWYLSEKKNQNYTYIYTYICNLPVAVVDNTIQEWEWSL